MSDRIDKAIEDFNAPTPAPEYKPMSDAYAPPEPEKEPEIDKADLREAARKRTEEENKADQREPIVREYKHIGGPQDGEPVAPNETLDINRAARDVARARDEEASIAQQADDQVVQNVIDATRADVLQPQPPQPDQQQPPQVDVQQQQSPEVQAQQQQQSAEDEARRLIENPAIREALSSQLSQLEAQRAQYARAAGESFDMAHAALLVNFPELQNVSGGNLGAILNVLQQREPQRYAAVVSALLQTDKLHQAATQAKAAEAQIAQARQKAWSDNEDKRFAEQVLAREPKETTDAVIRNAGRILKQEYGIEPQEFAQMFQANPQLRAAPVQAMVYDLIRTKLAQESISQKRQPAPVPPVQRPGAARPFSAQNDDDVASALARFKASPSPQTGASLLNARRASRK